MEQTGTQTIATFNGKLLMRKRMPGKPFVQLVFREAGKDWLCLTSNLQHAARLQMGKKYKIEGLFKSLGGHQYIHEPNIVPLAREISKRRVWISLAIALAVLLTAGGIVLAAGHKDTPKPPAAPVVQQTSTQTQDDTTPSATSDTTTDTQTDTPATTPATTTTTPKTTPKPPASNPVATPLAPHCDSIVTTTLPEEITYDDTTPAGTPDQVTQGIDRQTQTCYPDVGTANGSTNTLVAGQPPTRVVATGVTTPS